jgi:hypothetical protein
LEDARARAIVRDLPRYVPGIPLPAIQIDGLPVTISGTWSLWEVRLASTQGERKRYQPVFVAEDGRSFAPTARRIWDLLVTEKISLVDASVEADQAAYLAAHSAAETHGETIFAAMLEEHKARLAQDRERLELAFEARSQAIGRIGLPAVRDFRRKRLEREHAVEMARVADAEAVLPELNPVLLLRIGMRAAS